jgi:hypothetical protein
MMTTLRSPFTWWEALAQKSASDTRVQRQQCGQRGRTYPLWMWRSGIIVRSR